MRTKTHGCPWLSALAATAVALTASSVALADGPVAAGAPVTAPRADAAAAPGSNGTAAGVTGTVLGIGALGAILVMPACTGIGSQTISRYCVVGAGGTAIVFLAVGMPLLVLAESQSHAFKEWKAAHPGLSGLGLSTGKSAGTLTWTAQF